MREQRLGFVLIASSLAAISAVGALLLASHREASRERNRVQGRSIARLLAGIPIERLRADATGHSPELELLRSGQGNADFAYATLVGVNGAWLALSAAPGVNIPDVPSPLEPPSWNGERLLDLPSGGRAQEFFAPVLNAGELVALARVGFFEPRLEPSLRQTSVVAMVALPVFLLVPLAWWLVRREVTPLAATCQRLQESLSRGSPAPLQIEATGLLADFVNSFNRFVEVVGTRASALEERGSLALAASKVATYQKVRIESVLETLPDAVLVLDETGRGTFANAKFSALFGAKRDVILGHKPGEWCDVADLVALLSRYDGTRRYRSETAEFDLPSRPDCRLELSAHPMPAGEGDRVHGTLAVVRDVTAASLARKAQGEFVTHVAHELKTPLNTVAMYAEELLEQKGAAEEFRVEACNVIRDEVERVSLLVGTLLTIARIETGAVALERQPIRLHEFLQDALETVARGRGRDLHFALEVPKGLTALHADKELLRVALNNLLTNAIKYNREGGEVVLAAEETHDSVAIRVRDTGIGMSEDEGRRAFDKFYRSDAAFVQSRSGHGLGLSLAREIVALHGGEIALRSTPGEGSEFSILLRKGSARESGGEA
jgi:two-component system sensor histidine kinase VicK